MKLQARWQRTDLVRGPDEGEVGGTGSEISKECEDSDGGGVAGPDGARTGRLGGEQKTDSQKTQREEPQETTADSRYQTARHQLGDLPGRRGEGPETGRAPVCFAGGHPGRRGVRDLLCDASVRASGGTPALWARTPRAPRTLCRLGSSLEANHRPHSAV